MLRMGEKLAEGYMAGKRAWRSLQGLNTIVGVVDTTLCLYRAGVAGWEAAMAIREVFNLGFELYRNTGVSFYR